MRVASRVQLFRGYLILMVAIKTCLTSTTGQQDADVIRDFDGDVFANPDDNCNVDACREYNNTTVGGYCFSQDSCCSQCRCKTDNPTFVAHEKQCMSLERFRKMQKVEERYYVMAQPGKNCNEACNHVGGACLSQGHGFIDASTTLSIFKSLNVSCKPGPHDTDNYGFLDNPAYSIARAWKGRCLGFKNVPYTINCEAGVNVEVRRLCPCNDCRYWLNKESTGCSSSNNKISLLNLSTEDSITLEICGLSYNQYLSNCVMQQLNYLQESHWVTFGDKQKNLFKVELQDAPEKIMLKWNRLDSNYNGIIGYSKIKCDLKGDPTTLCFVFKSNGSRKDVHIPTSRPFVTTDAKQQWSTSTNVAVSSTPSSTTRDRDEGGFKKKKDIKKNSTTIAAAVTSSVVVILLICVIVVVIFCRRRRRRETKSANEVASSNPTYGQGPGNTLLLHARDGTVAKNEEETKNLYESMDNTYEVPADKPAEKMQRSGNPAKPVRNPNAYETIDPAAKSTYYYAKDVVDQIPKTRQDDNVPRKSQNPDKDRVYNVLGEPPMLVNNNVTEQSENPSEDHVYNALAKPDQSTGCAENENEEMYNVLEREPITDGGYNRKNDEHVYHYAN